MSKRIVIDASVARGAGESEHPTSQRCRSFLEAVLRICHHMVLTADIEKEWQNHESNYATRWRATMESRGKVDPFSDLPDLETPIASSAKTQKARTAMLKDAHLIAGAMAADQVVASLDEKARGYFGEIAHDVKGLGKIAWVNVSEDDQDALDWAEAGARSEPARRLGRPQHDRSSP
jgi:hypothetical protein